MLSERLRYDTYRLFPVCQIDNDNTNLCGYIGIVIGEVDIVNRFILYRSAILQVRKIVDTAFIPQIDITISITYYQRMFISMITNTFILLSLNPFFLE